MVVELAKGRYLDTKGLCPSSSESLAILRIATRVITCFGLKRGQMVVDIVVPMSLTYRLGFGEAGQVTSRMGNELEFQDSSHPHFSFAFCYHFTANRSLP